MNAANDGVPPQPGAMEGQRPLDAVENGGIGPGAMLDRLQPYALWLILVLGLLALLPFNGTIPLIDRDEPRFAQATREMLDRRDFIIPYFNDEYRFDKPPLTYWLMAVSYAVFGENEWAARLHSVLASILVALVVWRFGARLVGARASLAAAIVWLTGLQVFIHGRAAVADMPMVLGVAVACWGLYELLSPGDAVTATADGKTDATPPGELGGASDVAAQAGGAYPWRWFLALYGGMGVGFMAKGPIALAVPLLAAVLWRFALWRRGTLPWGRLRPAAGALLLLAIIAPWGIPALIQTQGKYWQSGINKHVVERGLKVFHGRKIIPGFYLLTLLFSFFPWIAFLGDGWNAIRRFWSRETAFLSAWALSAFLIFSFYSTQLPHYTLPAFPALCLLVALCARSEARPGKWATRLFWTLSAGVAVGAMAVLLLAVLAPLASPYDRLRPAVIAAAAGTVSAAVAMIAWRLRLERLLAPATVAVVLCLGLGARQLRSLVIATQATDLLAMANRTPDTACVWRYFEEGSLVFYSDHSWRSTKEFGTEDAPVDLPTLLAAPGPRLLVFGVTERKLDKYLDWQVKTRLLGKEAAMKFDDHRPELSTLDLSGYVQERFSGLNLARGSWVEVLVAYKAAPTERGAPPLDSPHPE